MGGREIVLSESKPTHEPLLRYTHAGYGAGEVTRGEAGRREGRERTRIQHSAGGKGGDEGGRRACESVDVRRAPGTEVGGHEIVLSESKPTHDERAMPGRPRVKAANSGAWREPALQSTSTVFYSLFTPEVLLLHFP